MNYSEFDDYFKETLEDIESNYETFMDKRSINQGIGIMGGFTLGVGGCILVTESSQHFTAGRNFFIFSGTLMLAGAAISGFRNRIRYEELYEQDKN